jgi:formylglycine-generating enzyme required for sulfatase activity
VNSQVDVVAEVEEPLRAALVDLLAEHEPAVPQSDRITAGRLLGELGDPRFPVTIEEWQHSIVHERNEEFGSPNGYWCYVRPGTYQIGGWNDGEERADITLPGFWIARYLITAAEFSDFAQGGYTEQAQRWWTPCGWYWKKTIDREQPEYWQHRRIDRSNQAITLVTWYEAVAFCHWLHSQLADDLPTNYEIRLPTEKEWEIAAVYDRQHQRRIKACEESMWLKAPMPVGTAPTAVAACGVYDILEQALEWTASRYQSYSSADNQPVHDFGVMFLSMSSEYIEKHIFDEMEVAVPGSGSESPLTGHRGWYQAGSALSAMSFRIVLAPSDPTATQEDD